MPLNLRNGLVAVAAVGVAALGGSAIAGAAGSSGSGSSAQQQQQPQGYGQPPQGGRGHGGPGHGGRHVGANGVREKALPADVAAKVKAAALAKFPGATVERVETDADHGSPYEAHITTKDGKQLEVLVDKSFAVTDANEMQHP